MKRNYQRPSLEVVQVTTYQQLLTLSGDMGGHATKPAKARKKRYRDHDDWEEEDDDWDEEDY